MFLLHGHGQIKVLLKYLFKSSEVPKKYRYFLAPVFGSGFSVFLFFVFVRFLGGGGGGGGGEGGEGGEGGGGGGGRRGRGRGRVLGQRKFDPSVTVICTKRVRG